MTGHPDPHDTEGTVDRLEEKVLGHTVDQTRDDEPEPTEDAQGSEPTD
ncbi:hypothetical protein GCM10009836_52580 [Pseudonocardia ailaonensis]|uniref:Autophagy-related protein 2 n=1 Tax=Pseudonocardia ailaonensis TaxID=367279 RepID=A0ABN2NFR5_9PSEU